MRRSLLVVLAALLVVGCEEAASDAPLGEEHCTEARDPTGFYCGGRRDSTQDVVNRFRDFPDDAVWLFIDSAETGTLGPDGEDFEWTFWAQFPAEGGQFYWTFAFFVETPAPAISGLYPGCDDEPGLQIYRSRVLVPLAIDTYEAEVGPVVLDELTRTAFRQRAACTSPTGEAVSWWSYTRWDEEAAGNRTAFVLFDGEAEPLGLRTGCLDEMDPTSCPTE